MHILNVSTLITNRLWMLCRAALLSCFQLSSHPIRCSTAIRFYRTSLPTQRHRRDPRRAQSAQYSWPWTDHLIDRASSEVGRSAHELKRALSLEPKMRQIAYQQLAARYRQIREQQQNIDAHIQYNRLWQEAIAANRSKYDRESVLHDRVLKRQEVLEVFNARYAAALTSAHGTTKQVVVANLNKLSSGLTEKANLLGREIDAATDLSFDIPGYVRVEQQISNWIIHVPFYTDIQDNAFVQSAKRAIEDIWHLRSGKDEFRIQLHFSYVSPEHLYGTDKLPRSGQPHEYPEAC